MIPNAERQSVTLVCMAGPDLGKRLAVTAQPATIGRASTCEVASDDPDAAERHATLQLKQGIPTFQASEGSAVFLDGQRDTEGRLEFRQQLRIGRSLWQLDQTASPGDFTSLLGSISGRISEVAGVEKIEGFSVGAMFSEIWRRRTDEEMEHYFAVGTPANTPPLAEVDTSWPKPWLFFKTFALVALVYMGFLFAFHRFNNVLMIPGLLTMGAFVMPFTLLIFFFEMNAPRNVPLYQILKLLFLGGVLSLLLSLFLFDWTQLSNWLGPMSAGLVEETGKAAALFLVINKLKYRWILNGILFGAAVGAGFAAFESAGYALRDGLRYGTGEMLSSITMRGLLTLCGTHTAWTALIGGALWRVRGAEKFDWTMLKDVRFLRVFALCAGMHMIWNSPLHLPFYLKYIALGFVAWIALLSFIQAGLRQVRAAQATGATDFFKRQAAAG